MKMLGHESAAMTPDVYADLADNDLIGVASKLCEILGKIGQIGPEKRVREHINRSDQRKRSRYGGASCQD